MRMAPTLASYKAAYAKKMDRTADSLPQSQLQKDMDDLVSTVGFKNKRHTRSVAKRKMSQQRR